jgi:hypothetical protein
VYILNSNFNHLYLYMCNIQWFLFYFVQHTPVASSFISFLDHTQTHHSWWDSSGREISSSQRSLPDNTPHSQQKTHPSPRWDSNPQSVGERPHTYHLDRAATGIGDILWLILIILIKKTNCGWRPGEVILRFFVLHVLFFFSVSEAN